MAIDYYTQEYGLTPGQPSLLSAGLDLLAEKCETDDALADYNEAVRIDPKSAKAYDYRGIACFAKKDYDMAIADYSEAIRLDPKIVRLSGLSGMFSAQIRMQVSHPSIPLV